MTRSAKQSRGLLAAVILLWLLFAQALVGARLTSLTTDEPLHIISGYSYLRTGDARLVEEHPPLVKVIAAWPLLLLPDLGDPRLARGWNEGSLVTVMRAMLLNYPAVDHVAFAARVPVMWLGLLLAALVYRWATDWNRNRPMAGLIALGLCALDPNIVAHAQLATTDIGVTLFLFAAWYALWRWMRCPSLSRLALTGVLLGSALASKVSSLLAVPVVTLVVCAYYARRQSDGWRGAVRLLGRAMGSLAVMAGIAFFVVWAVYGFELRWLPGWSVPIPAASHLIPLARLFEHQRAGHSSFVWGQNSQMGWWYYFPVAFVLKTPLPTLALLVGVCGSWVIAAIRLWKARALRGLGTRWETGVLLAFPVVYLVSALFSTVDIGYRHLLPILPFLFVFIGVQISAVKCRTSPRHLVAPLKGVFDLSPCHLVILLLAWCIVEATLVFPYPLEYFNELAGGPANGYRFLVDSNLDWGQSFKALKRYLDERGVRRFKLSAMMFLEPSVYGLDYEPLPPSRKSPGEFPSRFNPEPGVYVISASSLQGVATPDINTYAFFRSRTPTARIGNALFVYDVPEALPGEWVAQCISPAAPLELADVLSGFGRDLRRIYLDCAQSWWYPAQAVPGWHVSPPANSLSYTVWYSGAQVVWSARTAEGKPGFDVVHVARPAPPDGLRTVARSDQEMPVAAPVETTGPLAFEGFWLQDLVVRPGQPILVFTAWRVIRQADAPLSIMAHLLDAQGRVVANGDGVGVPVEMWQVGDVIVQAHRLGAQDGALGRYQVETGVYRLDTLERYQILQTGRSVGDRLRLASVGVSR